MLILLSVSLAQKGSALIRYWVRIKSLSKYFFGGLKIKILFLGRFLFLKCVENAGFSLTLFAYYKRMKLILAVNSDV